MTYAPAQLDHTGIAQRIPHQGRMCLLGRMLAWSPSAIHCSASSHRDPDNPLRSASGLISACAIEYAAQAMALHGTLTAAAGTAPSAGYLASVRSVRLTVPRLDDIDGELQIHAERLAGLKETPGRSQVSLTPLYVGPRSPGTAPAPRGGEQLSSERPGDRCSGGLTRSGRFGGAQDQHVLYQFRVNDKHGALLAEGRAVVVLNTPLPP